MMPAKGHKLEGVGLLFCGSYWGNGDAAHFFAEANWDDEPGT